MSNQPDELSHRLVTSIGFEAEDREYLISDHRSAEQVIQVGCSALNLRQFQLSERPSRQLGHWTSQLRSVGNYGHLLGGSSVTRAKRTLPVLLFLLAASAISCQGQPSSNVWSWGANEMGQIGVSVSTSQAPRLINLSDVVRIAAGFRFSMALKRDGTVWQWGSLERPPAESGGICFETTGPVPARECSSIPRLVSEVPKAKNVGAGRDFAMAVLDNADSTVCRWGLNEYAQLGNITTAPTRAVVCSPSPKGVLYVDGGGGGRVLGGHVLAITSGPPELKAWAWGRNDHTQAGNVSICPMCPGISCNSPGPGPAFLCIESPLQIPAGGPTFLTNVIGISAGNDHSLALKPDGSVWSWGSQDFGQLGVPGANTDAKLPVRVAASNTNPPMYLNGVSDIAAGGNHSLALSNDGHVWAWGFNDFGQVGVSTAPFTIQSWAREIPGLDQVTRIAAGDSFSLALRSDGTVWAWGRNDRGQLGALSADVCGAAQLSCSRTPVKVENVAGATAIAAGGDHSLALVG